MWLADAGVDVVCVARPETAATIAHEGLTLEAAGRTLRAKPQAVERLAVPVDLLLVTVKAPYLDAALDRVEASAGAVVPLLNGLEHVAAIRERLGPRVAPGTISRFEAYRDGPTRIVQTTTPGVVTMASDDLPRADLERAAEILERAGFETAIRESEQAVLWEKAARLAVLSAATALTQQPVAELATDPEWRPVLVAAIAEACAVATADGVPLSTEVQWAIIDGMPGTLTTSTARDVAAGRPSELDAITGAVVRAGRRLGVATPTLDQLFERCRASLL